MVVDPIPHIEQRNVDDVRETLLVDRLVVDQRDGAEPLRAPPRERDPGTTPQTRTLGLRQARRRSAGSDSTRSPAAKRAHHDGGRQT